MVTSADVSTVSKGWRVPEKLLWASDRMESLVEVTRGIDPVSWLKLKSKTLRLPSCATAIGMVPCMSQLANINVCKVTNSDKMDGKVDCKG